MNAILSAGLVFIVIVIIYAVFLLLKEYWWWLFIVGMALVGVIGGLWLLSYASSSSSVIAAFVGIIFLLWGLLMSYIFYKAI